MDFETSLHDTLGNHYQKVSKKYKNIPPDTALQIATQLTVAETQAMYLNSLQGIQEELSYIRKILQKTMLSNNSDSSGV
jgi:hypothetical protein